MLRAVRGLGCLGLIVGSPWAHAERAPLKAAATKQPQAKPAKPIGRTATPPASTPPASAPPAVESVSALSRAAPSAAGSVAPRSASAPTLKDDDAAKSSEAASASDSPSNTAPRATTNAPGTPPAVRVFMRSGTEPLLFSARAKTSSGAPTLCTAPCDTRLLPGDYQLRLNGVMVDGPLKLVNPGTWHGQFESREAGREGGWLALNVGGILGGVFITVAALGGPSWAYVAGGGSLLSGGVLFVLAYRADRATVSFTPGEPVDMLGLPPPVPAEDNSSGPTPTGGLDRPGLGGQARGLGFRVTF